MQMAIEDHFPLLSHNRKFSFIILYKNKFEQSEVFQRGNTQRTNNFLALIHQNPSTKREEKNHLKEPIYMKKSLIEKGIYL